MTPSWRALLTLNESCGECGIPFIPGRGEMTGGVEMAVYFSSLIGLLVFLLVLLPSGAPLWASLAWAVAFGALFPVLTYRHFRGAWVGTMYGIEAWPTTGDPPHEAPIDMPRLPWDD